ncbi:hypothetical protein BaRGS_00002172, partial [Batillaria attramentaria]
LLKFSLLGIFVTFLAEFLSRGIEAESQRLASRQYLQDVIPFQSANFRQWQRRARGMQGDLLSRLVYLVVLDGRAEHVVVKCVTAACTFAVVSVSMHYASQRLKKSVASTVGSQFRNGATGKQPTSRQWFSLEQGPAPTHWLEDCPGVHSVPTVRMAAKDDGVRSLNFVRPPSNNRLSPGKWEAPYNLNHPALSRPVFGAWCVGPLNGGVGTGGGAFQVLGTLIEYSSLLLLLPCHGLFVAATRDWFC